MSRFHSYINTSEKIIAIYKGDIPFPVFIKSYFASEKKFGSKDRKQISELCFNYFRLALALEKYHCKDKILTASFLYNSTPTDLINAIRPEWNELITQPVAIKMKLLHMAMQVADIFPFKEALGPSINVEKYCLSFIKQPYFFVRLRPKLHVQTIKKIELFQLPFILLDEDCVQLPLGTSVENFLLPDKEVVIQDYNSQKVLNYLKTEFPQSENQDEKKLSNPSVWDCCAASGGKSILLYDLLNGKCNLTVSDIRPSILSNLHQRFKRAAIKDYHYFITDIAADKIITAATIYDMIICDAPCTGSGTWSRTPEQLLYFKQASIDEYSNKQKKITANLLPHLKKGGLLFYITCSVFEKENETIVTYLKEAFSMELLQMNQLHGYDKNADSMFVAVFRK